MARTPTILRRISAACLPEPHVLRVLEDLYHVVAGAEA